MPRNIPTIQTPETLATYATAIEQLLLRLRHCEQQLRDNQIPVTEATNDDSYHKAKQKLSSFVRAVEEAVNRDLVAAHRASLEKSPHHSLPAKKKTKGRGTG